VENEHKIVFLDRGNCRNELFESAIIVKTENLLNLAHLLSMSVDTMLNHWQHSWAVLAAGDALGTSARRTGTGPLQC
jgi:hypothetical protein